ncbi:hypothetical protein E1A91_D04G202100v1, partial [Gossypium mustelinum]
MEFQEQLHFALAFTKTIAILVVTILHGPTFLIRLGVHRALVVSNLEVAKECFTTNDKVFPTHRKSIAVKYMGYDYKMLGFAHYGPYWRNMRKLAMVELFSSHWLELLKHVDDNKIGSFIKELYVQSLKNGGVALLEIKERIGELATNIIESRRFLKALSDFFYLAGLFLVSNTIPFLDWLDVVMGIIGKIKRTEKELDFAIGSWVNEHCERRLDKGIEGNQDFIDVMLSIMDENNVPTQEADVTIRPNCLQQQVEESDIANLVYLQAIIKETMRLYPAAPVSVVREAMDDYTVANFHIPAGTQLLLNLWKLHRDPRIWHKPLDFLLERFLSDHANIDVRGQNFELIPFGAGRRICPGITFALHFQHLALAQLLHGLNGEWPRIIVPKATPLEVTLKPKLPSVCY